LLGWNCGCKRAGIRARVARFSSVARASRLLPIGGNNVLASYTSRGDRCAAATNERQQQG
jgi:hypothetical protein